MYHQIRLSEDMVDLFGFEVDTAEGQTKYFRYLVLAFGLSTAVYITEKLIKPIKTFCIRHNIDISVYIDDGILIAKTSFSCEISYKFSVFILMLSGWQVQPDKCVSIPTQTITYLGYILNSRDLTISVPESKIKKVIVMIDIVLDYYFKNWLIASRTLAALTGLLAHCNKSHGGFVRILSREIIIPSFLKKREKVFFLDFSFISFYFLKNSI